MVYFRGHPADYDEWAELGCTGWPYAEVLPWFIRSEDNADFRGASHGQGGGVHVSSYAKANPLSDRFVAAAEALGHRRIADFNVGDPEGFGLRQATIRNGRRVSAATAFLNRARRRANLEILTDRMVDKVIFEGRRATGVLIRHRDQAEQILASREVILAAGSYSSPAILERSGIGDATLLSRHGIAVHHNLPEVGRNLQDHIVAPVQMRTTSALPYVVDWRVLPRLVGNLAHYLLLRGGPLASNVFEATGYARTSLAGSRPDVQLIFMPMDRAPGPLPRKRGYGILGLLRPKSRGQVHVTSSDPAATPMIDPGFFTDPADMPPVIEGVRLARQILTHAAFADLASEEILPGSAVTGDAALTQAIRENCVTVHHPVGTCRMGGDEASVVDPQLRLRGLDRLRVVDASIMPRIIGGNTAAPVYMIAEKAADMILNHNI